jgi:hypothetical protein
MIRFKQFTILFVSFACLLFLNVTNPLNAQIEYNWQNSKEGWVSAPESNFGCALTAHPESMSMRAFNETPIMRSGTQDSDLELDSETYNRVDITLKNPTTSGNPNARLFIYPSASNDAICYYNIPVDTEMEDYSTYTVELDGTPSDGTLEGSIARFGLRGPWGVANMDTIWWQTMIVYSSFGCIDPDACNFNEMASDDDGSCIIVGDPCDDGDANTVNDVYTDDCDCVGEPFISVGNLEKISFNVFPNPSSDYIQITSDAKIERLLVRNISGKTVLALDPKTKDILVDIRHLSRDTFFMHCLIEGSWVAHRIVLSR